MASFCLFSFFSNFLQKKSFNFSGIRTRIIGVEDEHADHLTTNTAQRFLSFQNLVKLPNG